MLNGDSLPLRTACCLALFLLTTALPGVARADDRSQAERDFKNAMRAVYAAFRNLQPFLHDPKLFLKGEHSTKIAEQLSALSTGFHVAEDFGPELRQTPGFESSIELIRATLDDALKRFREGNKEWALYRLKTIANNCIACHVSYKVELTFQDPRLPSTELSAFERGEFLLATRQFDKASKAFFEASVKPDGNTRIDALRKWLIIYTRVTPHPAEAITQLGKILRIETLHPYERLQISEWLSSLHRWKLEKRNSAVPPLRRAENLLRQALGMHDPLSARIGTVELLRATALLHRILEERPAADVRSRVLYLLGVSYARLPLFFINELPELYLEQCVRENPGSPEAQEAFKLYRDLVVRSFTGASGIHLPGDVSLRLRELHDIAFGLVTLSRAAVFQR